MGALAHTLQLRMSTPVGLRGFTQYYAVLRKSMRIHLLYVSASLLTTPQRLHTHTNYNERMHMKYNLQTTCSPIDAIFIALRNCLFEIIMLDGLFVLSPSI